MNGRARACRGLLTMAALFGTASMAGTARAQLIQQNFPAGIPGYEPNLEASVVTHMMQENQANGAEVGDFIVKPKFSESGGYDSAPIGSENAGSSTINSQASVNVNSDWGRDALGASFSVDDHHYFNLPEANYTNWVAGVGGALTLGNDTASLAYSHQADHLNAQDLGVVGVATPVPYGVDDVRLSYQKLFSRLSITPSFEYESYKFGSSAGALTISDNALSHRIESGAVTGSYGFAPGNAAVVIVRLSEARFPAATMDDYLDTGGFAGLDFRGSSIIQYRALAGYEIRRFNHLSGVSIGTPVFELDSVWMPTGLDTVTVSAYREFSDPTSAFARDQIVTYGSLELDHELRENFFLRADAHIGRSQPESAIAAFGVDNQTQYGFGAAAFWNLNHNLTATLSYNFLNNRDSGNATQALASSGNHPDFTSNIIMLGFTLYE